MHIHIILESQNPSSKAIFDKINRSVEKWFKIGYIYDRDLMFLFVMGFYVLYSFGIVFAACEEFEDEIQEFDWYLFPYKLQRMLLTILMVAQQPIDLICFGNISILRNCFKKVCLIYNLQISNFKFKSMDKFSIFKFRR